MKSDKDEDEEGPWIPLRYPTDPSMRCVQIKKDGKRCLRMRAKLSDKCWAHGGAFRVQRDRYLRDKLEREVLEYIKDRWDLSDEDLRDDGTGGADPPPVPSS